MHRRWSAALVLSGGASYGLVAIFIKHGYRLGFTAGDMAAGKMLFGAALLWLFVLTRPDTLRTFTLRAGLKLASAGALVGVTGLSYYKSMESLPASVAIALFFQFTWIGALYEWILAGVRPRPALYAAIALTWLGTLFAAGDIRDGGNVPWQGVAAALFAAFTFAGYLYASGRVETSDSPLLRSAMMLTGAFAVLCVFAPPTFLVSGALAAGLWKIALAIALVGAGIPALCFAYGAPSLSVGATTILGSAELPVTVASAYFVLGETVTAGQWFGAVVILLGIVLGNRDDGSK